MKRFAVIILVLLVVSLFTSCKKCQTCTITVLGISVSDDVCQDDFDSKDDYKDAIKDIEDAGGKCK